MTHFAYQLYCSRNFPPLRDTCMMLGKAGFTEVEGFGGLFADIDGLRESLNHAGLQMTSSHIGLDQLEDDLAGYVKLAKSLGMKRVYVPYLMPNSRPTDDAGWRAFGQKLAEFGKAFTDSNIAFGWHNHDFEFFSTETDTLPIDLIAEAEISLELDLGWVARAGLDPVAWIKKYGDKITSAHVKDIAPLGDAMDEDGWADVGHGTLDWPAIHAALQAAGVDHYVVEHDNPKDHARFAQRSLATLKAL